MAATILTLPTILQAAAGFSWGFQNTVLVTTSPHAGNSHTYEVPGWRWVANMEYNILTLEESAKLKALLVKMRGQANRLKLFDFGTPVPRGTLRGTPTLVEAIEQGDTTMVIDAPAGKTVKEGDYLLIEETGQVVMVVDDAAEAGGERSINFGPPARADATEGSDIGWDRPSCLFIPTDSRMMWPVESAGRIKDFRIQLMEIYSA